MEDNYIYWEQYREEDNNRIKNGRKKAKSGNIEIKEKSKKKRKIV